MTTRKSVTLITTVIIVISLIILIIALTSLVVVQDVKSLDMDLQINNFVGFNVDADKISFGVMPPGNIAEKKVVIENYDYEKSMIRIKVIGELEDWISVSENNFLIPRVSFSICLARMTGANFISKSIL